jgi:hypothetical protein
VWQASRKAESRESLVRGRMLARKARQVRVETRGLDESFSGEVYTQDEVAYGGSDGQRKCRGRVCSTSSPHSMDP